MPAVIPKLDKICTLTGNGCLAPLHQGINLPLYYTVFMTGKFWQCRWPRPFFSPCYIDGCKRESRRLNIRPLPVLLRLIICLNPVKRSAMKSISENLINKTSGVCISSVVQSFTLMGPCDYKFRQDPIHTKPLKWIPLPSIQLAAQRSLQYQYNPTSFSAAPSRCLPTNLSICAVVSANHAIRAGVLTHATRGSVPNNGKVSKIQLDGTPNKNQMASYSKLMWPIIRED